MKGCGIEVKIVCSNQALVAEVEMDEMWSFVLDKSHQRWLWWAFGHNTGVPWVIYCFGTREHKHLDELRRLLFPFRISIVYCDDTSAYEIRIVESVVDVGKRNT